MDEISCNTDASGTTVSGPPHQLPDDGGSSVYQVLTPDGVESLITAEQAARLCRVSVATIRTWVHRQTLAPSGLNDQGRQVFRQIDVAKAEKATRKRARRG